MYAAPQFFTLKKKKGFVLGRIEIFVPIKYLFYKVVARVEFVLFPGGYFLV